VLTAWRLVKTRYEKSAFSGEGAAAFGARWNPPGVRVVYTAQTAALAAIEVLVQTPGHELPSAHTIFRIEIPEEAITALAPEEVPADWDAIPSRGSTQAIGQRWITRHSSLVLRVPSVVIRQECNYLINPDHTDFPSLQRSSEPFRFDPRLSARTRPPLFPQDPIA
jgi:RES domain-containing protein